RAARAASAAEEIDALPSTHQSKTLAPAAVRGEIAGLALVSGSDSAARNIVHLVDQGSIAPELLARLGWWYLRGGRTADAEKVLRKGISMRPGNGELQNALGWTSFEKGDAVAPFASYDGSAFDPLL